MNNPQPARELTLAEAVTNLTNLESQDELLSQEAATLRARLSEIDAGAFGRMEAMGAAHHKVIAAAKRGQA